MLKGCLARRAHGGEDPATARGNLRVSRPAQTLGVFRRPSAREHEMGMTINEARGDPGASHIVVFQTRAAHLLGLIPGSPEPRDPSIAHRERAVLDHAHARIAGRDVGVVPQTYVSKIHGIIGAICRF